MNFTHYQREENNLTFFYSGMFYEIVLIDIQNYYFSMEIPHKYHILNKKIILLEMRWSHNIDLAIFNKFICEKLIEIGKAKTYHIIIDKIIFLILTL